MEGGGSSYSDERSVDSFPDEESVTETEEDENSENSEDDGEMKEEIDPWATMIDDAKATVQSSNAPIESLYTSKPLFINKLLKCKSEVLLNQALVPGHHQLC